jgi:hypothetical protein
MSLFHDFYDVFCGYDQATNFGAQLFRLIAKADFENRERLREIFPSHVELYEKWQTSAEKPNKSVVMNWAEEIENRE